MGRISRGVKLSGLEGVKPRCETIVRFRAGVTKISLCYDNTMIGYLRFDEWDNILDKRLKKSYWGYLYMEAFLFGALIFLGILILLGSNLEPYIFAVILIAMSIWEFVIGQKIKKDVREDIRAFKPPLSLP